MTALPTYELREYQRDCARAVWVAMFLRLVRCVLMVLPTGAGKTYVFARIADEVVKRFGHVLVLAHREELVNQAVDQLYETCGLAPGTMVSIEMAASKATRSPVVVASVQSMVRRLERWPKDFFRLIIVDEAHHALAKTYQDILGHFKTAHVLGVTATPDRGDRRSLAEVFTECAYEISLFELIRQKHLCPIKIKALPIEIDLSAVTKKSTGDFDEKESARAIEPALREVIKVMLPEVADRKTLIFLPLRRTSRLMVELLREHGVTADHIDGDSADRQGKLAAFRRGEIQFLCNAMLLTEGYDEPSIECVVPLRPTMSRSLFSQIVGRGTRNSPDTGKDDLLLLDFLWQHEKHALIRPAHLVAEDTETAEAMTAIIEKEARKLDGRLIGFDSHDIEDLHKAAAVDAQHRRELKLRQELREANARKAKCVDAATIMLDLDGVTRGRFSPTMPWHHHPVSAEQNETLIKLGVNPDTVTCAGHAVAIIEKCMMREHADMATQKQIAMLRRLKVPNPERMTKAEATKAMLSRWKGKHFFRR